MPISVSLKLSLVHLDCFPFLWLLRSEYFCRHCRADLMVRHNTCWLFLLKTQGNLNPLTFSTACLSPLQYSNVTTSCVCQTQSNTVYRLSTVLTRISFLYIKTAFAFYVYKVHILFRQSLALSRVVPNDMHFTILGHSLVQPCYSSPSLSVRRFWNICQ